MPDVIRPESSGVAAWEITKRLVRALVKNGALDDEAADAILDEVIRSLTEAGGLTNKGAAEAVRQYQTEFPKQQ